ncbi:MAG TPA: tetratricopeptide repeat protein [Deltaproteobacteria bacterium]|nr:tetratricopeptide repeat protein [Deltaproteobacteria bacterium]
MAKLSKKDLKEPDFFQASVKNIAHYIEGNKTRFYVVLTSAVVTIVIALGIYLYWSGYQKNAMQIYSQAQTNMLENMEDPAVSEKAVDILKELIKKYPYSRSARIAHYHLGNIYYKSGDLDNAIFSYKKYLSSVRSDNAGVKFLTLTSLGYCYEAKKDFETALDYFEQAQKSYNVGFESIGYRNIGRIYEAMNDTEKALENYRKALEKNSDPSMDIFIQKKIASLS